MAPAVIDRLESVQVDEQQGHGLAIAARPGLGQRQRIPQCTAVQQASQGVVARLVVALCVHALALRDVVQEQTDDAAALHFQRIGPGFDGQRAAVFSAYRKLHPLVRDREGACSSKACNVLMISRGSVGRHDQVGQWSADRFGVRPAQDQFGLPVPGRDDAAVVQRHVDIAGVFEDVAQFSRALSQRLFGQGLVRKGGGQSFIGIVQFGSTRLHALFKFGMHALEASPGRLLC